MNCKHKQIQWCREDAMTLWELSILFASYIYIKRVCTFIGCVVDGTKDSEDERCALIIATEHNVGEVERMAAKQKVELFNVVFAQSPFIWNDCFVFCSWNFYHKTRDNFGQGNNMAVCFFVCKSKRYLNDSGKRIHVSISENILFIVNIFCIQRFGAVVAFLLLRKEN